MKEIFYLQDTLTNKISYYLLMAFLIALPFDMFYSEMLLSCLLIHSLIHLKVSNLSRLKGPVLLVVALYGLTLGGTLYSDLKNRAFIEWGNQAAFVLFPLILSTTSLDLEKHRFPLVKAFALSCLFTVLYLYLEAWRTIRFNGLSLRSLYSAPFMNHQFSSPIGLHATYFSMYIGLSLLTFTLLFFRSSRFWARTGYAIGMLVLLASLLQLASRAVCVSVLIILVTFPFFFYSFKPAMKFVRIALPLAACFLVAMTRVNPFKERYIVQLKKDLVVSAADPSFQEPRVARWQCAWILIKASPWIGHGTGSEIPLLKEIYYERHLYSAYLNDLNSHNQYLSFWVKTGLVGLLIYLLLVAKGFIQAIRTGDLLYYGFMVIVFCVSFSENILDANKGIFFISFFSSLFFITAPEKSLKKRFRPTGPERIPFFQWVSFFLFFFLIPYQHA
jgi:O-antigen ligase